jgi:hypothetical protein
MKNDLSCNKNGLAGLKRFLEKIFVQSLQNHFVSVYDDAIAL